VSVPNGDKYGITVLQVGSTSVGVGVVARYDETYAFATYGTQFQLWSWAKTAPMHVDAWSSLKVDVAFNTVGASISVNVDGTSTTMPGYQQTTPSGTVGMAFGPSNILIGGGDGGAGDLYNGPCDMLVDDILVLNTK